MEPYDKYKKLKKSLSFLSPKEADYWNVVGKMDELRANNKRLKITQLASSNVRELVNAWDRRFLAKEANKLLGIMPFGYGLKQIISKDQDNLKNNNNGNNSD
jgi:hypothetical protein